MENCKHLETILTSTFKHINEITEKYLIRVVPDYASIREAISNLNKNNVEQIIEKLDDIFKKIEIGIILCNKEASNHIKKILIEIKDSIKIINNEIIFIDKNSKELLNKIDNLNEEIDSEVLKEKINTFFNHFYNFINKVNSEINNIDERLQKEITVLALKDREIEELKEKVFIDDLTGLLNKRGFNEVFSRLLKSENNVFILFIDVDNFKYVNDSYGHIAGDLILKKLSEILRKNLRDEDIVARIYGDEFIIIFKNINKDVAVAISERIRNAVANSKFLYNKKEIRVTISGGLSKLKNWLDRDKNIEIADKLLYKAKKSGNKIEVER